MKMMHLSHDLHANPIVFVDSDLAVRAQRCAFRTSPETEPFHHRGQMDAFDLADALLGGSPDDVRHRCSRETILV